MGGKKKFDHQVYTGERTLGGEPTCLWEHVDRAKTPFGKRLLRWWVTRPLVKAADIEGRLDTVDGQT